MTTSDNLTYDIIGVSGTGKSTLASEIAFKIEKLPILSTDMLKDGLRFVVNSGRDLSNLTAQEINCLRQPSKKISLDEAILAAHIVGNVKSYFCNVFFNEFPNTTLICEGFFIPEKKAKVVFLEKSIDWFYKINLDRILKRHGEQDCDLAKNYANHLFTLQKIFKRELDSLNLESFSVEDVVASRKVDARAYLINEGRTINPSIFAEQIFKYVGITQPKDSDFKLFEEGVMHAYRRTTDLK